jgi:hypothetical protein
MRQPRLVHQPAVSSCPEGQARRCCPVLLLLTTVTTALSYHLLITFLTASEALKDIRSTVKYCLLADS